MSRDDEPVFDRLYKKRQLALKEGKDGKVGLGNLRLFSPQQKSVKLNANEISQRANDLYLDAQKRKDKLEELNKKTQLEEKKNMVQTNSNTNKYILKRFVTQYKKELQKIIKNDECKQKNRLSLFQLGKNYA